MEYYSEQVTVDNITITGATAETVATDTTTETVSDTTADNIMTIVDTTILVNKLPSYLRYNRKSFCYSKQV